MAASWLKRQGSAALLTLLSTAPTAALFGLITWPDRLLFIVLMAVHAAAAVVAFRLFSRSDADLKRVLLRAFEAMGDADSPATELLRRADPSDSIVPTRIRRQESSRLAVWRSSVAAGAVLGLVIGVFGGIATVMYREVRGLPGYPAWPEESSYRDPVVIGFVSGVVAFIFTFLLELKSRSSDG
jgi:hypothetical protein